MFFRGYVETKDKQCVEKFKGRTDFKTYEQVKSLPEFAGILAEDTILIDLDDGESSDVLFKVVQDYSNKSLKPFPANGFTYRAEVSSLQSRNAITLFAGTSITALTLMISPKNTSYPLLLYTALLTTGANHPGFYFCPK